MRMWVPLLLLAAMTCGLSACANKGPLRSPSQIASDEAKKAKKDAKAAQQDENIPTPTPSTNGAGN